MRIKNILLLFIFTLPLVVSCNSANKPNNSSIPIKHTFKNGVLTSYIEKLDPKDTYSIQLNAYMKGMEDYKTSYNNSDYMDKGDSYTAELKIPRKGTWILQYKISNNNMTWTYSTIEILGENKNQYYLVADISPEIISINDEVKLIFKIFDQYGEMTTFDDINLKFSLEDSDDTFSVKIKNVNGVYSHSFHFNKNGEWRLDVISELVSDSFLIPVGEEARKAIDNTMNTDNGDNHEHHENH